MENGEVVHDNNNDIDGKRDINNNEKKDFGNPINKFFGENFFKDKKESTTSDSSDDMENKEKELKKSKWKDKKKELLQEIVKLKNELENEQSLVKVRQDVKITYSKIPYNTIQYNNLFPPSILFLYPFFIFWPFLIC